jgi:hypothetical protein
VVHEQEVHLEVVNSSIKAELSEEQLLKQD